MNWGAPTTIVWRHYRSQLEPYHNRFAQYHNIASLQKVIQLRNRAHISCHANVYIVVIAAEKLYYPSSLQHVNPTYLVYKSNLSYNLLDTSGENVFPKLSHFVEYTHL